MNNILTSDMDTVFEKVYQKLSSPDFGKNLGGELPLYIQPIPVSGQTELNTQVERLVSRLSKLGKNSIVVDLYRLALEIIDEEGILETLLEDEKNIDKDDLNATFESKGWVGYILLFVHTALSTIWKDWPIMQTLFFSSLESTTDCRYRYSENFLQTITIERIILMILKLLTKTYEYHDTGIYI